MLSIEITFIAMDFTSINTSDIEEKPESSIEHLKRENMKND